MPDKKEAIPPRLGQGSAPPNRNAASTDHPGTISKIAPPWVATPLPRSASRPQLRCPACAALFTPPAETCPVCRIDLRLGCRRKKRFLPKWLQIPPRIMRPLKKVTGLGLTLALIGLAANGIYGYLNRPPAMPAEVPRAPDTFQRLAGEYPVLLRPYVVMYKTQAAVADYRDNLVYRQRFMEELAKASETGQGAEGDEALVAMSRRMTPGQRIRMLRELLAMSGTAGDAKLADKELMQEMHPAEAARELRKLDQAGGGR
jgi:hypothetical protein